jgi:hypothetical protein
MALALTLGCGASGPTNPLATHARAVVDVTVRYVNLEGGCWTLEAAKTVRYLPLNLPDQFRHDGLNVHADLVRRDDYASTCMVGPVVEILSIQPR